jgi:predicted DNA-binding protein
MSIIAQFHVDSQITLHAHWSGSLDMDIVVVCCSKVGHRIIGFTDYGSLSAYPYIELLTDFTFTEVPTDNQEIAAIAPDKISLSADTENAIEKIYVLAWDFTALEEETESLYQEANVFLEIHQGSRRWKSVAIEKNGNLIEFGYFVVNSTLAEHAMQFISTNVVHSIAMPEDMDEILQYLSTPT